MKKLVILYISVSLTLFLLPGCDDNAVEYKPGPTSPSFVVTIPTVSGSTGSVLPGENVTIPITVATDSIVGSFKFLIGYDSDALSLISPTEGADLSKYNWEYFNYTAYFNSITCPDCPSAFAEISAIAEIDNVPPYAVQTKVSSLFEMTFRAINDTANYCTENAIRFFWRDCTDNQFINWSNTKLFTSDIVYSGNADTSLAVQIQDPEVGYPTFFGSQNSDCNPATQSQAFRDVIFINGSIFITCPDSVQSNNDYNQDKE